jgi:alpha-tubulin suppressor-like RCC1 family protein
LLPRVANAAAVATPTNGMMVYDISQKCVIGYENNVWSACLSNTGGGGGGVTYPWETDLRFTQYFTYGHRIGQSQTSGGVSTDGNVYLWGLDQTDLIANLPYGTNVTTLNASPVIMPGPWNGIAKKVYFMNQSYHILTTTGKVYAFGYQNRGFLGDGVSVGTYRTLANAVEIAKPAGVTAYVDILKTGANTYYLGDNGNIYLSGVNVFGSSSPDALTPTLLPKPAGIFITNLWMNIESSAMFIKGSDGNIYGTGYQNPHAMLLGFTPASGVSLLTTNTWKLIPFPAGESAKIVKMSAGFLNAFALTSEGKLYGWGLSIDTVNDPVNVAKHVKYVTEPTYLTTPFKVNPLPALVALPNDGSTKFLDVVTGFSNLNNLFVTDKNNVFALGVGDPGTFTDQNITLRIFDYQVVLGLGATKIKDIEGGTPGFLARDINNKLWSFGGSGQQLGSLPGVSGFASVDWQFALPMLNGNFDKRNPRPQTVN